MREHGWDMVCVLSKSGARHAGPVRGSACPNGMCAQHLSPTTLHPLVWDGRAGTRIGCALEVSDDGTRRHREGEERKNLPSESLRSEQHPQES